jgi:hypothetical protein
MGWRVLWGLMALTWAQLSIRDSAIAFFMPAVAYSGLFPRADLASRFGYLMVIQGEVGYKLRSHWYFILIGGGLIGDKVREAGLLTNYFSNSLSQSGYTGLFDENGRPFAPVIQAAGLTGQMRVGKIFPALRLPGQNPNCGPFVEFGAGYLRHRIDIDKARSDRAPILEGDYLRGVDRLTAGWGLTQSIGYRFFSSRLLLNFYVAVEAGQFFTRSLRGYVYDLGRPDTKQRLDAWMAFRGGWVLPLYEKAPLDE